MLFRSVGHSERRSLFGETDAVTAAKVLAALDAGLSPILCVGESLAQREAGDAEVVVRAQLDRVVDVLGAERFAGVVVAYEPVWAIGTGRTATPKQAQQMHAVLRAQLQSATENADKIRLLYGGSMNAGNAAELLAIHKHGARAFGQRTGMADRHVVAVNRPGVALAMCGDAIHKDIT